MSLRHETPRTAQSETETAQTLHAMKRKQPWTSIAKTVAVVAVFGAAVVMSPRAPSQGAGGEQFDAESDVVTGTVICSNGTEHNVAAADQTVTDDSGGNALTSPEISESLCGKPIYDVKNVIDISDADDTPTADGGFGEVNVGSGSVLGGLISWDAAQVALECDSAGGSSETCQSPTQFANLRINGQQISGDISSGTQMQLTNVAILGSSCAGVELFTGTATLGNVTINQSGSSDSVDDVAIQVAGSSTCVGLQLGVTQYKLAIGGPRTVSRQVDDNSVLRAQASPRAVAYNNVSFTAWNNINQIQSYDTQYPYSDPGYAPTSSNGLEPAGYANYSYSGW